MAALDDGTLTALARSLPDTGELAYAARRAIRAALAARAEDAVLALELMCAQRVRPIWARMRPDDDEPAELALAARTSPTSPELAAKVLDLGARLGDLATRGPEYGPSVSAGLSYWAVARNLAFGLAAEPEDADGETDIDPDTWTPCFHAASAEAGGPTWTEHGDPAKRRAFWRWYLLEAVPAVRG